jgi:hypothetical protein
MRQVLFWISFIPLAIVMSLLGLLAFPMLVYRGCCYVLMELLDRYEVWCFNTPGQNGLFGARRGGSLWKTFKEGFEA